jgi:adenylate kinase family enzyme
VPSHKGVGCDWERTEVARNAPAESQALRGGSGSSTLKPAAVQTGTPRLGRRIAIYGETGCGKTTMARRLCEALDLPFVELDRVHWRNPGWQAPDPEEFRQRVRALLDSYPDGWVCEGNYRHVRDLSLRQADSVIWMHLAWRVSFWRLLKRSIQRCWNRELLWGVQRESWRLTFLSRKSVVLNSIWHYRATNRSIARSLREVPHNARVHELLCSRQVEALIAKCSPASETVTRPR